MDESMPYDPEFSAALRHLLAQRGWTSQELCERTRERPGAPRRIVPSSVSDWAKRSHPSNRAIMIVCKTLGVTRSHFFELGESLVRLAGEPHRPLTERDLGDMAEAVEDLSVSVRRTLERIRKFHAERGEPGAE